MELEDFAFFLYALLILGPLMAVYVALRGLKWQSKGSLFLDAWFIWLAWFASSIVGLFASQYVSARPLMFPELSTYWQTLLALIPILAANLGIISLILWLIKRRSVNEGIKLFDERCKSSIDSKPVLYTAFVTTVAAIFGLVVSVAIAGGS